MKPSVLFSNQGRRWAAGDADFLTGCTLTSAVRRHCSDVAAPAGSETALAHLRRCAVVAPAARLAWCNSCNGSRWLQAKGCRNVPSRRTICGSGRSAGSPRRNGRIIRARCGGAGKAAVFLRREGGQPLVSHGRLKHCRSGSRINHSQPDLRVTVARASQSAEVLGSVIPVPHTPSRYHRAMTALALEDMHDLAGPLETDLGVLGLIVPDPPVQPLDLRDDHRLRLDPSRLVSRRSARRLLRVLQPHGEPIRDRRLDNVSRGQNRLQTGTSVGERGQRSDGGRPSQGFITSSRN